MSDASHFKLVRGLAIASAATTFVLIILGAVVRVSGSGLGCGSDWPLCHGSLIPLFDLQTFIEWNHRLFAGLVVILTLLTAGAAWTWQRKRKHVLLLANAAVALLIVQIALGAITVELDLPPQVVMAHLGTAMLVFATLLATAAVVPPRDPAAVRARFSALAAAKAERFHLLTLWTAAGTFVLMMSGSLVTGSSAEYACPDWPLCKGLSVPTGGLAAIHFSHRVITLIVSALIVYTVFRAIRRKAINPLAAKVAHVAGGLLAVQIIVGAFQVWLKVPPWIIAVHIGMAEAVWGSVVLLAVLAYRDRNALLLLGTPGGSSGTVSGDGSGRPDSMSAGVDVPVGAGTLRQTLGDYVALTKPEIIVLLLVTTVCAMFIASRSAPSPWLILWTTVGGALAAGGANALNCYVDHDIDELMTRTRRRPIPSGRMEPTQVLVFGLTLAVSSFLVMLLGVNMLAAVLSLCGLLFYVFVYTMWLKRSTPQNIVIGGAAGAVPPLVGWAAVTGRVDLAAWLLFGIIFIWTPPHFWALALLIKKDYARAGIPMLPVVRTEDHTRWQIFWYSVLLLPLVVMLVAIGALGYLFLVLAVGLTGVFIWYAAVLLRQATLGWARRLYRYSLLYLALLFGSMVLDHAVLGAFT
ncbi:MAG: heme o synthase [Chloroflexota bacterium]